MNTHRFAATLAACLALLSACGGSTPAASPAGAPPAGKPAASAKAAASAAPATSAAATGQAFKVGYIQTLTGPTANVGKDNLDGFNMYLESVGGAVAGRKIEVVTADDAGKPDVGVTKAKQLVENDHVNILMGINLTPVCYAVAAYARE